MKEDYSMIRYIKNRIKNNKNFLVTLTGQTGSGKSWSALSIGEMLDEDFDISRVIFKGVELMNLINNGNLRSGSVIVWDEAGIDLSNRNWQSATNKVLNYLLQTFRHRNFILIFTVPYHDFIDASTRKLFHGDFETRGINMSNKTVIIKPKLLQYNPTMGKWYRKYLQIIEEGTKIKIKRWAVPKPSDKLIEAYEIKKSDFTSDLNKEIQDKLQSMNGGDKQNNVIVEPNITCHSCGYNWHTYSLALKPGCPRCRINVIDQNFQKIILSKQQPAVATQLN